MSSRKRCVTQTIVPGFKRWTSESQHYLPFDICDTMTAMLLFLFC